MLIYLHSSVPFLGYLESTATQQTVELAIENFIKILNFYKTFNLHISEEDMYSAFGANYTDYNNYYREMLIRSGLQDVYDLQTLIGGTHLLIEKSPKIEDLLTVTEVDGNFDTDPNNIISDWPTVVQGQFEKLFSNIVRCNSINPALIIFSYFNQNISPINISLSGVNCCAYKTDTLVEFKPPENIARSFNVVRNISELEGALDPFSIWSTAQNLEDLKLAIYLQAKVYGSTISIEDFYLGSDFLLSLKAHQGDGNRKFSGRVFEVCSRITADIESGEIFTATSKSTSPPRTRSDGAIAHRVHLTKSAVGLRLMYWRHANGKIEFANIGPKKEENIADGNVQDRI